MKYYLLLIVVFLVGCKNYKERNEELIQSYPYEVQEHFRNFCQFGYDRGIKIDLKKLKVTLTQNVDGRNLDGVYYTSDHEVQFDTTKFNWHNNRETLIFHELGHGILKRGHNPIDLKMGRHEISIMNVFPNKPENEEIRQMRIDELFSKHNQRHVGQSSCVRHNH